MVGLMVEAWLCWIVAGSIGGIALWQVSLIMSSAIYFDSMLLTYAIVFAVPAAIYAAITGLALVRLWRRGATN